MGTATSRGHYNTLAGGLSQVEVAALLGISKQRVQQIEKAALEKLARNSLLRQLARDYRLLLEDDQ